MRSPFPLPSVGRLLPALLALCLVAPSLASAAELEPIPVTPEEIAARLAENALARRLAELRNRILQRPGDPTIAADLYELRELVVQGGSLERAADTLQRVVRAPQNAPELKALARRLLADVERERGRLPRMEEQLAALGTITEVAVIGPFDDENKSGFDVAWGPELDLDLGKSHPGLRGEVAWRVVRGLGRTGTLVLHEAIHPDRDVIAYALATIEAPRATAATLYLGTPGATKAWLNGKPILADPAYHPARFDQTAVPIELQQGRNVLLLKLAAGNGGPFELHARVAGPDGRQLRGLRFGAPQEGRFATPQPIPPGKAIRGRRPLVDTLQRVSMEGDPVAIRAWARVLGERHPFDESEKLHVRAAALAADADPGDVGAQLLAARWADDANDERRFLERAVAAEPAGSARAHAALARYWLARGDEFRAMEILGPALAAAPGDWQAALVYADALERIGYSARALALVEGLVERHRDEPQLLARLARYRLRDRRSEEAARMLRVVLGLRPADLDAAASLASILIDRGRPAEAEEVLGQVARLLPIDRSLLLRRADLLAANGFDTAARERYEEAAALAPQDAEVFERAGRSALRAGDTERALALFERALEVRPQDARLKEQIRSLRPDADAFATPFLHDLRAVATAWPEQAREDAVKLVELRAVRVHPSGQASRTMQRIVRVQSQRGVERWRSQSIRYAPDREVLRVERARVLKPDGTVIDAHTERERSMNEPWAGLYYDARARVIGFPSLAPGDVLELVWRLDDVARDNLLGDYFGDVEFVQDTVPTWRWEYVLEMPAGRRIYANELPAARYEESVREGGRTLHRWVVERARRIEPEPEMPGWSEVADTLHVSTYADWNEVGRFWWGLIQDQIRPTPTIERMAREIVAGIPASDVEGRVRAIHEYVVRNTRYVGLEFGIHSFKPYAVEQVLRRRFGDCKDKASLTWSLLRSIGIDARLVLLRMRHLGKIGSWPASLAVFNHAILYVPELDLWLDGTAEWSGTRELPEVDRGAEVLVVDPEGTSRFGTIPEAPADLSTTEVALRIDLAADGSASLAGESRVSGLQAPGFRRAYASPNGRKAAFEQSWATTFPGAEVTRLEMSDPAAIEEDVRFAWEMEVPSLAERGGDGRLSFRPLGESRSWVERFAPTSARRHPLVLRHAWNDRFRYEYRLPEGFEVERLPRTDEVESPFGSARLAYEARDGAVVVTGAVRLAVSRVEPEAYPAFRSFLGEVDQLFSRRIVLRPVASVQAER